MGPVIALPNDVAQRIKDETDLVEVDDCLLYTSLSLTDRRGRLAEFVELLDLLLRQPATSYSGTYYSADEARMLPGCLQRPRVPLALAAGDPRTMALVARYADA